jgi:hypothetical protein
MSPTPAAHQADDDAAPQNRGDDPDTHESIISPDTIANILALGREYLDLGDGVSPTPFNPFRDIVQDAREILTFTLDFYAQGAAVNLQYEPNKAPRGGDDLEGALRSVASIEDHDAREAALVQF